MPIRILRQFTKARRWLSLPRTLPPSSCGIGMMAFAASGVRRMPGSPHAADTMTATDGIPVLSAERGRNPLLHNSPRKSAFRLLCRQNNSLG